jgi:hypothetical protein
MPHEANIFITPQPGQEEFMDITEWAILCRALFDPKGPRLTRLSFKTNEVADANSDEVVTVHTVAAQPDNAHILGSLYFIDHKLTGGKWGQHHLTDTEVDQLEKLKRDCESQPVTYQ